MGGEGGEVARGIAVDSAGRAYVVGETSSPSSSFPVKTGPSLTAGGHRDAWIARITPAGQIDYCGYIAGTGWDQVGGVAVGADGTAYVAGSTDSPPTSFPVTLGPALRSGGGTDAWVARVRADGSGFEYCGYLGGADFDEATGVALDRDGAVVIAGDTYSREDTFPVRIGPDLTFNSLPEREYGKVYVPPDAFIARVKPDGSGLAYCGYLGGAAHDAAAAVAVDNQGRAYVGGSTYSRQPGFPARNGPDLTFNSLWFTIDGERRLEPDAFVARVKQDGAGLEYCGYLGGEGADYVTALAATPGGDLCAAGGTEFTASFPFRAGLYDPIEGFSGIWTARIVDAPAPDTKTGRLQVTPAVVKFRKVTMGTSRSLPVRLRNRGPGLLWLSVPSPPVPFSVSSPGTRVLRPGETVQVQVTYTPSINWSEAGVLAVTSSDPRHPLVQVFLTGEGKPRVGSMP